MQPKMIGDVLTTSVIFVALRKKYPKAQLHYFVNSNTVPVLENNKNIDKIIAIKPEFQKGISGLQHQIKIVQKEKYDIIIDSYAKLQTAIVCKFSGALKTISFYKTYSRFFYSDTIIRNKESISIATKGIEHRLQLLEPLGIPFEIIKPTIYLTSTEIENAKSTLTDYGIDINKIIVMISALGSSTSKTYPLEYMASVIDEVAETTDVQILMNYIPNQKNEIEKLYNLCSDKAKTKIYKDFYASSLRDFMAVTHFCKALIGNEGGATNMAKALNVPTFTIFAPQIKKNDWNMFENGTTNVSVHISDYQKFEISKKNTDLQVIYQQFKPEFFSDLLRKFITNNLK